MASATIEESSEHRYELKRNMAFPWLIFELQVTSKQLHVNTRNYILGFIPAGKSTVSYPLHSISSVVTYSGFSLFRLIWNLCFVALYIFVVSSYPIITSSIFLIVLAVALELRLLHRLLKQVLIITNHAGERVFLHVSFVERKRIQEIAGVVNKAIAEL